MQFSFVTLTAVVVVNSLYIGFMFLLQELDGNLPPRHSLIPGTRQKFLYVQDFHSYTWGDLFGIPLIFNAFAHLILNGEISDVQRFIFMTVVIIDGLGFMYMCLGKNHKPDQGYPEIGKVSAHGISRPPYHGIGEAMSLLVIWHIFVGSLRGPVMWVALAGGVIYIASFICDILAGNFESLKRIE
jgi:hypothetical protein